MRSAMSLTLTTLYNNFGKSGGLMAFKVRVKCIVHSVVSLDLSTQYIYFGKSGGLVAFNVHVDSAVLCH